MTVIAAPFYRQGDDAEYRRIRPRSEIDPMTKSDVLGCSELIRTVNQQHFVPPLFMSINMERIFPVKMSDDVPDGVMHFFSHNATLISATPATRTEPSVGLYQAIVQLIPRHVEAWNSIRAVKTWELYDTEEEDKDEEIEGSVSEYTRPDTHDLISRYVVQGAPTPSITHNERNTSKGAPDGNKENIPEVTTPMPADLSLATQGIVPPDISNLTLQDRVRFVSQPIGTVPRERTRPDMEMIQDFVGPEAVKEPMVRKIRRCPACLIEDFVRNTGKDSPWLL